MLQKGVHLHTKPQQIGVNCCALTAAAPLGKDNCQDSFFGSLFKEKSVMLGCAWAKLT